MILEVDQNFPQPGIVEHAIEVIKNNHGIIVYPTDTVYGLGAAVLDQKAVDKISRIKKRRRGKQYSIICKDIKQIKEYAQLNKHQENIIKKYLPGPYTFILPATKHVPAWINQATATIAIRLPNNKLCMKLIAKLNCPLISTSLNISGEKVITTPSDITPTMQKYIDVILDSGRLGSQGSTIVDLTTKNPTIVRQGKGAFK